MVPCTLFHQCLRKLPQISHSGRFVTVCYTSQREFQMRYAVPIPKQKFPVLTFQLASLPRLIHGGQG